jgi:hypothetical protein
VPLPAVNIEVAAGNLAERIRALEHEPERAEAFRRQFGKHRYSLSLVRMVAHRSYARFAPRKFKRHGAAREPRENTNRPAAREPFAVRSAAKYIYVAPGATGGTRLRTLGLRDAALNSNGGAP